MKHLVKHALLFSASLLLLSGCVKPVGRGGISMQPIVTQTPSSAAEAGGVTEPELKVSEQSVISYITPTPDAPRVLPTFSSDYYLYVVQYGDSLGYIASLYNMGLTRTRSKSGRSSMSPPGSPAQPRPISRSSRIPSWCMDLPARISISRNSSKAKTDTWRVTGDMWVKM